MSEIGRTDHVVESTDKGFALSVVGSRIAELRGRGLRDGALRTPVLVASDHVLAENIRLMSAYCERHGVSLAPHAKTFLSPEVVAAQLEAGATAITVADVTQAAIMWSHGVRCIFIANEVVQAADLAWIRDRMRAEPASKLMFYIDSEAGIARATEAWKDKPANPPFTVLVELGVPGVRTGARSLAEFGRVLAAAYQSDALRVVGVAGFEGVFGRKPNSTNRSAAVAYLDLLREATELARPFVRDDRLVLSAGGSSYFELVTSVFNPGWRSRHAVNVLLRSGCYAAHDDGLYRSVRSAGPNEYELVAFRPALELWGSVLSVPEPGLAVFDFGKRHVGSDAGFPVALRRLDDRDSTGVSNLMKAAGVRDLYDQHAVVDVDIDGDGGSLSVGDRIGFGISHPCTTVDKWRLIPTVDDRRRIIGAMRTYFQ